MANRQKITIQEAEKSFSVLTFDVKNAIKGGCGHCEGWEEEGATVYSQDEYNYLSSQFLWEGGNVCGIGYIPGQTTETDCPTTEDTENTTDVPIEEDLETTGEPETTPDEPETTGEPDSIIDTPSLNVESGSYADCYLTSFMENLESVLNPLGFLGNNNDFSGVTIEVNRFEYSPNSTISEFRMYCGDNAVSYISGYFLEPPYNAELANVENSNRAIAAGTYDLTPYSSPKYPNHYEVSGVDGRNRILIHIGNDPSDTTGCLLPGESTTEDYVSKSGDKLKEINEFLEEYGESGKRIVINNDSSH